MSYYSERIDKEFKQCNAAIDSIMLEAGMETRYAIKRLTELQVKLRCEIKALNGLQESIVRRVKEGL